MAKGFKVVKKIKRSGFPTSNEHYQSAHRLANKAEKARYPKGYEAMKKVDESLPKGELSGKNTKSGKVEVSEKVPAKYRAEVAFHERQEHINIRRMQYHERIKRGGK